MTIVRINLRQSRYDIHIGFNLLEKTGELLHTLPAFSRCMIVTNPTVAGWYLEPLLKSLAAANIESRTCLVPDGEKFKNLVQIQKLYHQGLSWPVDRETLVIALGGGVIGDMTGFFAATALRGLPFIQIPTTLLAQVDSSIGGKVGVNHRCGKNLIGSFYQPQMVIIDPAVLRTLPGRELRAGMVELVKYGIIKDASLFNFLEKNLKEALDLEAEIICRFITEACRIKGQIVENDEKESGERAILNYGHTIGHALEAYHRYKYYRHGEAVAIGAIAAARLAYKKGLLSREGLDRQAGIMRALLADLRIPKFDPQKIWEIMQRDKKVKHGRLRMILTPEIGKAVITDDIDKAMVLEVLREINDQR